jgi:hydrophobe/amphiphile efflux-1 (HAE1) family protein
MLSRFFVNRPILASVISLLIMLAGGVAIFSMPLALFPPIAPPMVKVTASYPGADPKVVADTVAAPIEEQVNGVENMLYMYSTSSRDGSYTLKVTFELGTDIDEATVKVQNRVNWAMASLPPAVQRQGVQTKKVSTSFVAVVCLYSPDESYDNLFLTNYVTISIKDILNRVPGVGDVVMFPAKDYSMRVWLDPNLLQYNSLTTTDVVKALRNQNVQVAAGRLGEEPAPKGQKYDFTVNALGRLTTVEQFEDIILKTGQGGSVVRLKDVARVDLGAKNYSTRSYYNGAPAVTLIVYQTPEANALDVADRVHKTMDNLKKDFPKGVDYQTVYESSEFVRASIKEVVFTFIVAFILVFLVVFLFLQDWRATLVPATTVPVSIVGAFAIMYLMGFSINMLTLFGLVLAIGIVVDDAIVVVENVDRNMRQHGLGPKDASIRAMEEITGAIIGITLVLMAVFVPPAFLGGVAGEMYRQFSLTIAVTTLLSAVNAMTLKPVQCSVWLRPSTGEKNIFFRKFDAGFDAVTRGYTSVVVFLVRHAAVMLIVWAAALGLTYYAFTKIPKGFLPKEDDGLVLINTQLPDGASLQRSDATMKQVTDILKSTDGVAYYTVIPGYSILDGKGPNMACGFASLLPWDERLKKGRTKQVILNELSEKFANVQDGIVFPFSLPPIVGLGQSAGSEMWIEDKSGIGLNRLSQVADRFVTQSRTEADLSSVVSTFNASSPTLFADVDRTKALKLKVPLQSVFDTLQAYLGSMYVNDFNEFGRTWQVMVQADAKYRMTPEDVKNLQVRNRSGDMVPVGTLLKLDYISTPPRVDRYNMFPAIRVVGQKAKGASSGEAIQAMENLAAENLPSGTGYEWTGVAYQEKLITGQIYIVFAMAVLVVVMTLAALYESWIDPIAVIMVVPLAVLGAVIGLTVRGVDNSLYTQVGLILLVGLSAKNSILVVQFARERQAEGISPIEAAVQGAKLRFRAILMTSFAFIAGVTPLVIATGAGAASRQAVGTAVFFGMLGVTMLGIFFTPPLYVLMQRVKRGHASQPDPTVQPHTGQ